MGGILPFGCIFIQLFFVLSSIWSSHIYYMYGFLFLVFVILIITCSETTILLCYFHLCAEVSQHVFFALLLHLSVYKTQYFVLVTTIEMIPFRGQVRPGYSTMAHEIRPKKLRNIGEHWEIWRKDMARFVHRLRPRPSGNGEIWGNNILLTARF